MLLISNQSTDLCKVAQVSQIIITDVLFHPDHLVYFLFQSEIQTGKNISHLCTDTYSP